MKRSLADIGTEFGLSRERVRLCVAEALAEADKARTGDGSLPAVLELLRRRIGVAIPQDHLPRYFPATEEPDGSDYSDMLLGMVGPYTTSRGWLVLTEKLASDPTTLIVDSSDKRHRIDDDEARSALLEWGLSAHLHRPFLLRTGKLRTVRGRLVRWDGRPADKAEAVMHVLGEPCTKGELADAASGNWTRGHLSNILRGDSRFVRRTRRKWALTEWGLSEYVGVGRTIERLLAEGERQWTVPELMEWFSEEFEVAAVSVRAYCDAPMFVTGPGGVIRLRRSDEPFSYSPRVTDVSATPGVLHNGPEKVTLLYEVNDDVLRGCGRRLPNAAGALLGVYPGDRIEFTHEESSSAVMVSFPWLSFSGPVMGATRLIAENVERPERGDPGSDPGPSGVAGYGAIDESVRLPAELGPGVPADWPEGGRR